MIEAVERAVKNTDKPQALLYLAAAYPDELPNVVSSAASALKSSGPNAPQIAALVSLVGLGNVRDRRVYIRGVGTGAGWRELMERLAARNPDVQIILADDPALTPGLLQKAPADVPVISIGGASETQHNVDPGDPSQERVFRQRAKPRWRSIASNSLPAARRT